MQESGDNVRPRLSYEYKSTQDRLSRPEPELSKFVRKNMQLANSLSQWLFIWCIANYSVFNFFNTHKSFQGTSNVHFNHLNTVKIRREKPKVTHSVTLVMAFFEAGSENRQLEDLPQADVDRWPERFLLSVRTNAINVYIENYAPCLFL